MIEVPWFKTESLVLLVVAKQNAPPTIYYVLFQKLTEKPIIKKQGVLSELQELKSIAGHKPITLALCGKGIILKKISSEAPLTEDIIKGLLPDVNAGEFTFQVYQGVDDKEFKVAITRRNAVSEMLDELSTHQITVENCFLGCDLIRSSSQTNQTTETIAQEEFHNEKQLVQFVSEQLLTTKISTSKITLDSFSKHQSESRFFARTKKIALIVPGAVLLILLSNLFFYDHCEKELLQYEEIIASHRSQLDSIQMLEQLLEEKTKLVGNHDSYQSIPASKFADEIAVTVPSEITLTRMEIFPLTRKEDKQEQIICANDTLMVNGTTTDSRSLNKWIDELVKIEWVKGVNIESYLQESIGANGTFEILMTCK